MALMSFVYQGFTSFYPIYLVSMKGLSEGSAALFYSVIFGVGIVIQPLSGAAADAIGDRISMIGFAAISAVAFGLLVTVRGFWPLFVVSAILSAQLGFWPIAQAAVVDALPVEMQGTGFGFLRTAYLLLAATSPLIMGALGDQGLFDAAFLLLAGCALAAALLGTLLRAE